MSLLHPMLLLGMLLVGLPIVIHLIHRKRAVRRPFPPIEFLLRSNKRLARRLKVKQLLLLLFRVALFLLLPFALTQPFLLGQAGNQTESRYPLAVVFVLDDSASMARLIDGATLFERARHRLLTDLSELKSQDQTALVLAHSPPSAPVDRLQQDHRRVRAALEALTGPTPLSTDLPAALALARDIHALSDLPARRTVLLTDNAHHGWSDSAIPPEELAGLGEVEIIDLSGQDREQTPSNVAIVDGGYRDARSGGEGSYDLWARIRNHGDRSIDGIGLDLWLDEAPAGRLLVDLPPGGETVAEFSVGIPNGGLHRARFQLVEPDPPLEQDNRYFLTLHLDRQVTALLVNGDPRQIPYRDELYYLERALSTGLEDPSGVSSTVVGWEGLNHPFTDFDVVVLANVPALPRGQVAQLAQFIREGGGLLLTMGDRVRPEVYNALFADLLPKPLRSLRQLCQRRDPDAGLLATRLGRIDTSHPVFQVFDLPGGESLQSINVCSYLLLEPSAAGAVQTLAYYGDGGPALVEHEVGTGRVALWTTTVDRDWTDLPIRTAYLPMMRRLVRHLARRGSIESDSQAVVGQWRTINLEAQNPERVSITDPAGGRHVLAPEAQGPTSLRFVPPLAGHYQISLLIAGVERQFEELMFSANLDPAETDPSLAESELVRSFLAAAATGAPDDPGVSSLPQRRISLWPAVLLLFALVLCLELAMAIRRRQYVRIREWLGSWRWVSRPGHRTRLRHTKPGGRI